MAKDRGYDVISLNEIIRQVTAWIIDAVLVVVLAFCLTYLLGGRVRMDGNSMTPTLQNADRLLLNRTKGTLKEFERYDIVVYYLADPDSVYLKRILGLPGETVQIIDGLVYINGEKLPESPKLSAYISSGIAADPVTLLEGEYFVIGENTDASLDSRFNDVGNIRAEHMLGTVWFRYAPFKHFGFVS
ncbi:MAG: signal peptidase I [Lachnospiraceae bacterium]|nr:signal peptidase I [Lachnospiraceae bacterium]